MQEKNITPTEYVGHKLTSNTSMGFYNETTIQDFPISKKACFLKVKRRRSLDEDTWNIVAKGTRRTQELASFLKGSH